MVFAANPCGLVLVVNESTGAAGLFLVRGNDNQPTILVSEAPANNFAGGTTSTAGRISIFFSADESNYVLHNQTGSSRNVSAIHLGVLM
jgi:hypothetical protein